MSRATMSRDGRPRVTLRVEARMDTDDLANGLAHAVCRNLAGFDSDEWTPEDRLPGRTRIETAARESMRGYGYEAAAYWRDNEDLIEGGDGDDLFDWCKRAVSRAFPELAPRRG